MYYLVESENSIGGKIISFYERIENAYHDFRKHVAHPTCQKCVLCKIQVCGCHVRNREVVELYEKK